MFHLDAFELSLCLHLLKLHIAPAKWLRATIFVVLDFEILPKAKQINDYCCYISTKKNVTAPTQQLLP